MAARATKARKPAKRRKPARKPANRSLNDILIDLGRQALQEGVKQVLEDHGVDSGVSVELALVKARKPARRKTTRKATTRRKYTRRR